MNSKTLFKPFIVATMFICLSIACSNTPTNIAQEKTIPKIEPSFTNTREQSTITSTLILPQNIDTLIEMTSTNTPIQLTSTITQTLEPSPTEPQEILPGTYLVGTDIQPGLYIGFGGEGMIDSCYWARLKDVTGALDSILANDNSIGQFYIQVKPTDYALETKCHLLFLKDLPKPVNEFPTTIMPGMYLVGIDIKPGTYKGEGGVDIMSSCYWARLRDAYGDLYSIISNDNASGQFYVQIIKTDYALTTRCKMDWVK